MTPIPLFKPDIGPREIEAVNEALASRILSSGPKVEEFERLCAKLAARRHTVAVSSATAALHCALLACRIGPGDEVITTPYSYVASTNAILYTGAKPVFVDIDPKTLNLDPARLDAALTPHTKAILAVEIFGHPGGMLDIEAFGRKHDLALIEDAAEAIGGFAGQQPLGSFGKASIFSFDPAKQITTGEGGMLLTDDDDLAASCRALRDQGRDGHAGPVHQILGCNYRLSELSAALGVVQVQRLPAILDARRTVAHHYIDRLMTSRYLVLPTIPADTAMSWFAFVVRLSDLFQAADRDQVMQDLRAEGIACAPLFLPIHLQPYIARQFNYNRGDFPVCEYVSDRAIALPFFADLTPQQITFICQTLDRALESALLGGKKRF